MTSERIAKLSSEVARMRKRLVTARGRGQVELHVSLDDVELLVGLAAAGVRAYRLSASREDLRDAKAALNSADGNRRERILEVIEGIKDRIDHLDQPRFPIDIDE